MLSSSPSSSVLLLGLLGFATFSLAANATSKRGLCFVPNPDHAADNQIWVQSGSDLTWYYNYQDRPSPAYASLSQSQFEFIPMMWGVNKDNLKETAFLDTVKDLIDGGRNITHVLGFNEPDATADWGGSDIEPKDAAEAWAANFEPLGEMGIKLGLPACTGGWGSLPWLKQFLANCSEIISTDDDKKNCTWDFLPVHWYDNFGGLASHIGERRATWPDAEVWITEYAYANQDLSLTQDFFKQTLDYFDKEPYIGGYTYFGAFRSEVSNVGPNAVFLNNDGNLTAIGNMYLGLGETGADPQSGGGDDDSFAGRLKVPGWLAVGIAGIGAVVMGLF